MFHIEIQSFACKWSLRLGNVLQHPLCDEGFCLLFAIFFPPIFFRQLDANIYFYRSLEVGPRHVVDHDGAARAALSSGSGVADQQLQLVQGCSCSKPSNLSTFAIMKFLSNKTIAIIRLPSVSFIPV